VPEVIGPGGSHDNWAPAGAVRISKTGDKRASPDASVLSRPRCASRRAHAPDRRPDHLDPWPRLSKVPRDHRSRSLRSSRRL